MIIINESIGKQKLKRRKRGRDFLGIIQGFVPPKAGLVRSKKDNPIVRVCKTLR